MVVAMLHTLATRALEQPPNARQAMIKSEIENLREGMQDMFGDNPGAAEVPEQFVSKADTRAGSNRNAEITLKARPLAHPSWLHSEGVWLGKAAVNLSLGRFGVTVQNPSHADGGTQCASVLRYWWRLF